MDRMIPKTQLLVAILILFSSTMLYGYPGGITGRTLKGPNPGCSCHGSQSSATLVSIKAPASMVVNQAAQCTVTVSGSNTGVDIASSTGTLAPVSHLQLVSGELTHTARTTPGIYVFTYTAPATTGTQTLYATGVPGYPGSWNHAANLQITVNPAVSPPLPPVLAAPPNGSINQPTALTLSWNPSAGAASYRLQVSTDSLFGTTVFDDSTLTGTSSDPTSLTNSTLYYWHVRAKSSDGTSAYSVRWRFTTLSISPLPPVLLSPVNGASNQSLTVTLSWNGSSGASSYRLQVSTDSLFGMTVFDDSTLTGTSRQLPSLAVSTVYYWHVRAKNVAGISSYSATWGFTTSSLPSPVLSSPVNGATNQVTTLTLIWNAASGATSYRLQASTDSLFSTTVLDDSTLTGTSRQCGPLNNSTTYYWHVLAKNLAGTSAYSATWRFATQPPAPSAPVLASPADGATNQPLSPTLSWNASSGATTYRLQASTDSAFGTTVFDDANLSGTSRQLNSLDNSTTYYWHVWARSTWGTSPYSGTRRFTTLLPAPTLISPANGATNQPTTLALSWNAPAGATSYRVQASTDSLFSAIVFDDSAVTGTSRQLSSLIGSTLYYWHVQARNTVATSAYSATRRFTTMASAPPPPALVSPENGATIQASTLTLVWNASGGAVSYRLQVSADSLFGTAFFDDSTLTATSRQISGLVNARTYYWRVRAKNPTGTSAYSTRWQFSISLTAVDENQQAPGEFSMLQNYPNPFNPSTEIRFDLPEPARVSLTIYDMLGREISRLADGYREAGHNSIVWNAAGQASGVYLALFTASDGTGKVKFTQTSKLVLMK